MSQVAILVVMVAAAWIDHWQPHCLQHLRQHVHALSMRTEFFTPADSGETRSSSGAGREVSGPVRGHKAAGFSEGVHRVSSWKMGHGDIWGLIVRKPFGRFGFVTLVVSRRGVPETVCPRRGFGGPGNGGRPFLQVFGFDPKTSPRSVLSCTKHWPILSIFRLLGVVWRVS